MSDWDYDSRGPRRLERTHPSLRRPGDVLDIQEISSDEESEINRNPYRAHSDFSDPNPQHEWHNRGRENGSSAEPPQPTSRGRGGGNDYTDRDERYPRPGRQSWPGSASDDNPWYEQQRDHDPYRSRDRGRSRGRNADLDELPGRSSRGSSRDRYRRRRPRTPLVFPPQSPRHERSGDSPPDDNRYHGRFSERVMESIAADHPDSRFARWHDRYYANATDDERRDYDRHAEMGYRVGSGLRRAAERADRCDLM